MAAASAAGGEAVRPEGQDERQGLLPREAADERLHGVVSRAAAEDGPGQPEDAQL